MINITIVHILGITTTTTATISVFTLNYIAAAITVIVVVVVYILYLWNSLTHHLHEFTSAHSCQEWLMWGAQCDTFSSVRMIGITPTPQLPFSSLTTSFVQQCQIACVNTTATHNLLYFVLNKKCLYKFNTFIRTRHKTRDKKGNSCCIAQHRTVKEMRQCHPTGHGRLTTLCINALQCCVSVKADGENECDGKDDEHVKKINEGWGDCTSVTFMISIQVQIFHVTSCILNFTTSTQS